jgi:hypothetical protein
MKGKFREYQRPFLYTWLHDTLQHQMHVPDEVSHVFPDAQGGQSVEGPTQAPAKHTSPASQHVEGSPTKGAGQHVVPNGQLSLQDEQV